MKLNHFIDHTLLKADATDLEIETLCEEAIQYEFRSVCVNGCYTRKAFKIVEFTDVKVCTVVGFPLGAMATSAKVYETEYAIMNGATEIDMVINIGKLKSGDYDYIKNEILKVHEASSGKALLKVIIETCLLTDEEKVKACELAVEAGAEFVKTSTGFSTGGATVEDIKLMKKIVGDQAEVKASAGISTYEDAIAMIEAGATRIGASKSIIIVDGEK